MAEVLNERNYLKRNSLSAMLVTLVVVFVASRVAAQEHALSTAQPNPSQPFPLLDLFTGGSNYYSDVRKNYADPPYITCPKSDTLSSLANILGSAAKIMFSVAVIVFMKLIAGKLMLFPLTIILFAKIGLKTALLWPMIAKMIKYFRKKKKKGYHKMRSVSDCSERIACVVQQSSRQGWRSNVGAAVAFSLIDDVEEDSSLAKILLTVLAGEKVAKCMSVECSSGIDIS